MKFVKKSMAFILTLVMLLGLMVPALAAEGENPFTDVPANAYYHDAVIWAKDTGVTTGVTATQFQPEGTCTRGQVATFLWRAKGQPEPGIENPFKDVAESSPFYKAILWAYENGITTGVTADTFNPNGTCTNAHVVTFLWRAFGEPAAVGASTVAAAYPANAYYKKAVAWADSKGLLSNMGGAFAPNEQSPRSNIVTYLYRTAQDVVLYQQDATHSSHSNGTFGTNSSYAFMKYYADGIVEKGKWDGTKGKSLSNFMNGRSRLPEGEHLWFALTMFDEVEKKYYDEVTVSFTYVQSMERGNKGDMKVQDYGLEIYVSCDDGATWSAAAATAAYASEGTRVTFQETEEKLQEAYLYDVVSTNLLNVTKGDKITDIRIYPYGTKTEESRGAFALETISVNGKMKSGITQADIPSGYDPGVKIGDPWAKDSSLASYEIYNYTPSGSTYVYEGENLTVNSNRGWVWSAVVNGQQTLVPVIGIYNNTSKDGGLSGDDTLELNLRSIPNIDTSVFGAANVSIQYIYAPEDSDLNIAVVDQMQILVSTDNGKTWAGKTAGLRKQTLLGTAITSNGKKGVLFEALSEDIIDLVPAGSVITDVVVKPFGEYPRHYGAFRVTDLTVNGYKTALPAVEKEEIGTIKVDEETLRKIVVEEAYRTANGEWTQPETLVTYNWAGSWNVSSSANAVPMTYFGGYLHKGPVYTRSPLMLTSYEMWQSTIDAKGVLAADATGGRDGNAEDTVAGMDCSTFVYNATSRVSPVYDWNGQILLSELEKRPLTDPISNEANLLNSADVVAAFSKQQIYQHYAAARPGDIASTVPTGSHERLVTGEPNVVYNADGTIDPLKSTIVMSESGGTVRYYWQKPDGTTTFVTGDPAEYQKKNPDHKFLYGRSALQDEVYTFAGLYAGSYLISTLKEYQDGEVEKVNINVVVASEAETLKSGGFLAALESNYRMIAITAKIMQGDRVVFEETTYPEQRAIVRAYSSAELNTALKRLSSGDYTMVLDVTAGPVTTVGGEVPVTRVVSMPFTVR